MALPKEPRQLMINLMYLVLTALLALNVSNEILNAFQIINTSIMRSTNNSQANTTDFIKAFESEVNDPSRRAKAQPYYQAALDMQSQSNKLIEYLESLKRMVVTESGGVDPKNPNKPKDPGNIDAATKLFVENKFEGAQTVPLGDQLKNNLQNYIDYVNQLIDQNFDPNIANQLKTSFPIKIEEVEKSSNNPTGDWATGMFYHVPTSGALTLLSKYQNDVANAENQIIQTLYKRISDDVVFIQGYKLVASVNNAYVLAGDKVTGTINLVPVTSSQDVRNFHASSGNIRPDPANPGNTNVKSWETIASGTGLQTVTVSVPVRDGYGRTTTETAKMQYMVGSAGASMSIDKMNVFYRGVENPITVSAAGVSMQDVGVSIPGAKLTKTGLGKYNVDVMGIKAGTTVTASISGGGKQMGAQEVRILRIPDPIALLAGKNNAKVPANQLQVQQGIIAKLYNFVYEARYTVTAFNLYVTRAGDDPAISKQSGAVFNKTSQAIMQKLKPGDRVTVDEIKAKGPDGETRPLTPIIIDVI